MGKETKEIIKLVSKEILMLLADITVGVDYIFSKGYKKRRFVEDYFNDRGVDRSRLVDKISRLKRNGLIRCFVERKKEYLEITDKGIKNIKKAFLEMIEIDHSKKWDGKWRIIIFDIPEKERGARDGIRSKLYSLGFKQIQKSVFVYPFECSKEIFYICNYYRARKYIKYMIANIIEGEDEIIDHFLELKLIDEKGLHSKKRMKTNDR